MSRGAVMCRAGARHRHPTPDSPNRRDPQTYPNGGGAFFWQVCSLTVLCWAPLWVNRYVFLNALCCFRSRCKGERCLPPSCMDSKCSEFKGEFKMPDKRQVIPPLWGTSHHHSRLDGHMYVVSGVKKNPLMVQLFFSALHCNENNWYLAFATKKKIICSTKGKKRRSFLSQRKKK